MKSEPDAMTPDTNTASPHPDASRGPAGGGRAEPWTPGPWSACKGGSCCCGFVWGADGETHVAMAISGRDVGQSWHASDIAISDEEQHANARLITAAPDLYAALQGMVALWNGVADGDTPARHLASGALDAARQALARTSPSPGPAGADGEAVGGGAGRG